MKKHWAIKITIITFLIAFVVSLASEVASSVSGIVVATLILFFLILVSVLTDGIGVAVTACDIEPLEKLAKANVPGAKAGLIMVQNAEKVNNICADVIGDICSIISGACGAAIVIEVLRFVGNDKVGLFISILVSSITAGLTVGGKACSKSIAMNKAQEFVIYSARIISKFYKIEEIYERKKKKEGK